MQENFHSERECRGVGYEFTQTRSGVAWARDFTPPSFSFLLGTEGLSNSTVRCLAEDAMRVICTKFRREVHVHRKYSSSPFCR